MDDQSERSAFPEWDPLAPHVLADQRSAYDEMRGRCPIAHSDLLGLSVLRHADVLEVVHDHDTYRNLVSRHLSVPNGMDPPDHTSYRRLIEPYFAPGPMAQFEPVSDTIAADLVAAALRGRPIEVMDTLGHEFAVRVQCAFMGWSSDLHHPLRAWLDEQHRATLAEDLDALAASARRFDDVVREVLDVRRAAGADAPTIRPPDCSANASTVDRSRIPRSSASCGTGPSVSWGRSPRVSGSSSATLPTTQMS